MNDLIERLGGPAAVARMVGCKPPSVIEWRKRGIPAERRPDIERAKYPDFTVDEIADGVRWVRVPDPEWPHPHGRPCIDVASLETRDAA